MENIIKWLDIMDQSITFGNVKPGIIKEMKDNLRNINDYWNNLSKKE
eukprot:CAMPEP_0114677916 /NCGR_PEP_ID=MMETSP0191-20121206/51087_1 /TAXON_ID=126664 /ORGANISM="Sorites sp." /LENGTH=46 /DNA_ID= /DNA_START= /DNA_END= /DNA_ORIENTATION=